MPPKTNEELRKKIYDLVKEVHIQKPFEDVTGEPHYVTDEIMKILTQKDKEKEEAVAAARREWFDEGRMFAYNEALEACNLNEFAGQIEDDIQNKIRRPDIYETSPSPLQALTTPLPDQGDSK